MKFSEIGFWIRIAFLFLIRSGRSTAVLSLMVISAVSALIFLSALAVGVNDAMLRNTVGLFSGQIAGHALAAALHPEDLMTRGVTGVLKRVYRPGIIAYGEFRQPLMLCGIDPPREIALTALQKKVVSGRYPHRGRFEILISQNLAAELGVQRGQALTFSSWSQDGPLKLTVSGIYQTRIDFLDRGIAFCPLDVIPGKAAPWSAAIFLQTGVDTQDIIDGYAQRWPGRYRFESWETRMPDLRQLIDLEYVSMGIVIVLVFGVVSVGIACSFVIFIIKNIREYGIMKAMGVTTGEMSGLMNVLSCMLGLIFGALAVWSTVKLGGIDISAFTSHNQYFSVSGIIYPRLTAFSLLAPPGISSLFSLIAAVWPAALVARSKAADVMRMI